MYKMIINKYSQTSISCFSVLGAIHNTQKTYSTIPINTYDMNLLQFNAITTDKVSLQSYITFLPLSPLAFLPCNLLPFYYVFRLTV